MKNLLKLFFFFTLIIHPQAFSLESPDSIKANILKAYPNNVLALNVGIEDGVYRNDHIQMSSTDGFLARGICLKITEQTSHWKFYRIVSPELISKDSVYDLRSINQSQIPQDLLKYRKRSFHKKYNDLGDKEVNKQLELQQKRILEYDLPIELK